MVTGCQNPKSDNGRHRAEENRFPGSLKGLRVFILPRLNQVNAAVNANADENRESKEIGEVPMNPIPGHDSE